MNFMTSKYWPKLIFSIHPWSFIFLLKFVSIQVSIFWAYILSSSYSYNDAEWITLVIYSTSLANSGSVFWQPGLRETGYAQIRSNPGTILEFAELKKLNIICEKKMQQIMKQSKHFCNDYKLSSILVSWVTNLRNIS